MRRFGADPTTDGVTTTRPGKGTRETLSASLNVRDRFRYFVRPEPEPEGLGRVRRPLPSFLSVEGSCITPVSSGSHDP